MATITTLFLNKIMTKHCHYMLLLVLGALLWGCSGDDDSWKSLEPGVYVSEEVSKTLAEMDSADALYVVNGEKITKADFDRRFALDSALHYLRTGRAPSKSDKKFLKGVKQNVPSLLVQKKLLVQGAAKAGITEPPEKYLKKARTDFERSLPRTMTQEALKKKLGDDTYEALQEKLRDEAIISAFMVQYWTNSFVQVDEEVISNKWAEVLRVNAKADVENAKMHKKALEFRQKVLDGGDFAELTKKYAKVHPEHGQEWQTAVLAEFSPEEEIYGWLKKAQTGDVSEPLEMDDGLSIVKVVERRRANLPKGFTPEDEYVMVKCTFYIFNKYEEGTSPDTIRIVYLKEKYQSAYGELGIRLWNQAVIQLPNGENFFGKKK